MEPALLLHSLPQEGTRGPGLAVRTSSSSNERKAAAARWPMDSGRPAQPGGGPKDRF